MLIYLYYILIYYVTLNYYVNITRGASLEKTSPRRSPGYAKAPRVGADNNNNSNDNNNSNSNSNNNNNDTNLCK